MRKLLVVLMALALLVGVNTAFAAANIESEAGGSGVGTLRSYTCINTDSIGYDTTNISTSTIIPGKTQIIGYRATVLSVGTDGTFSIRDASSSTTNTDIYIINEAEATTILAAGELFPAGVEIQRGITIMQGPRTAVTVYYIQRLP